MTEMSEIHEGHSPQANPQSLMTLTFDLLDGNHRHRSTEFGEVASMIFDLSYAVFWHCWSVLPDCETLSIGRLILVMLVWPELCMYYCSSGCTTVTSIISCCRDSGTSWPRLSWNAGRSTRVWMRDVSLDYMIAHGSRDWSVLVIHVFLSSCPTMNTNHVVKTYRHKTGG